jgi:hypothetical protein
LKRLLVISWSLPPLLGARSIQVGRTLKVLVERDWKITALTVDPDSLPATTPLDYELADNYLHGLELIRIKAPISYRVFTVLRKIIPSWAPTPDDQVTWASRLTRTVLTRYKARGFDAMLTFGHPWSDHLAGNAIMKRFGLPWVAHFSDPWADNPYYTRLSDKQMRNMRAKESSVIQGASAFVFTSDATVNLVMSRYPKQLRSKAYVVPHGFDKSLVSGLRKEVSDTDTQMNIVHTGNLYGLRSPKMLIESLVEMRKTGKNYQQIKITFVGRVKNKTKWQTLVDGNQLQRQVQFHPTVSYNESLQMASGADVLLLIDAPSKEESVFLPSKLVDYLAFDKPIMGLTPERGTSADLLRRLGCFVVSPDDIPGAVSLLGILLDSWQADELKVGSQFGQVASEYDIRNTTGQLDRILNEVM